MHTTGRLHIVLAVLAALAGVVLFSTYGTVLPAAPFSPISLNSPSVVDSDNNTTVVVDSESRRALILNAEGNLTGVVSCATADCPIEAITDVCVGDNAIYLSGIRFVPDSDVVDQERVVAYDKDGSLQGIVFEIPGMKSSLPAIKSLSDMPNGVAIAYEKRSGMPNEDIEGNGTITILQIGAGEPRELMVPGSETTTEHDVAFTPAGGGQYATLSLRGIVNDYGEKQVARNSTGRVFTSIDIGDDGTLYACDDETGALCASPSESSSMQNLIKGTGYTNVHVNNDVISLCDGDFNTVLLCTTSGTVTQLFTKVNPSLGASMRLLFVWACGLYLVILAAGLGIRKTRRILKSGDTQGIGPMFLAVAVVSAIAVAIGSLSYSSYQASLQLRANEINTCADYLQMASSNFSETMQKVDNRDAIRANDEQLDKAAMNLIDAIAPALTLVNSANQNNIGMYCTFYGRDEKGIFYLYGSSLEHVMGTSVHASGDKALEAAFQRDDPEITQMHYGSTLRDTAQYRYVQILSSDGKSVAGVIEIGSRMRSFESSLTTDLAQRILGLLVMVLVIYLAYCELRACGRCLLSYRQLQADNPTSAVAVLTRPFTLGITILASIDSVMTVLIARDILQAAGMGDTSPLLALPAVMLGIGLALGQGLYGALGARVGLRRLMARGAGVMFLCACFTGIAVSTGIFWLYCAAKLAMAVPFGMLYALGYSLPRLADNDDLRAKAAGGVKRTDTSAAALGTILGGYAAQALGDAWVYAIVAVACIPIIIMALNLLPHNMRPLESLAQPERQDGRIRSFVRTPVALAIVFCILLPATVASGYASFLFPLFSTDLGLSKSDVNNIIVLGLLVVYVCINRIDSVEARVGKWRLSVTAIALIAVVFLLFAINTTLVWSVAVIALVAVLAKSSDGWKGLWMKAASDAGVPAGSATGAMFAMRSMALIAQPFILGALLGAADNVAVIIIGVLCAACAGVFFLVTRDTALNVKANGR